MGGGWEERGKRLWKKTHNGAESRMRGCWSSRKLREWSEGSQVERWQIGGEVEGDVRGGGGSSVEST